MCGCVWSCKTLKWCYRAHWHEVLINCETTTRGDVGSIHSSESLVPRSPGV
jgi:hypothetical protein